MYGGLFGDLPAAKKRTSDSNANNGDEEETKRDPIGGGKATSGSSSTTEGIDAGKQSAVESSTVVSNSGMFAPRASVPGGQKKSRLDGRISSSSHQFLQTVGKAGTTMAFVPTAALKRKHNPASKQQPANRGPIKELETPAGHSSGSAPDISSTGSCIVVPSSDMGDITTTIVRKKPLSSSSTTTPPSVEAVNIHGGSSDNGFKDPMPDEKDHREETDLHVAGASSSADRSQQHHQQQHATETSNASEITDPYDPYIPNDLLQYWERQALAQERERLERETREALEKQRLLRERLERERQELEQSGNYQELIQRQITTGGDVGPATGLPIRGNAMGDGSMGRGRGRGRGVSNLPAWLVEKQRQMQQQEQLGDAGDDE